MKQLVPIKIKIELNEKGQHKYPAFNELTILNGMDWSQYVDKEGLGWHYDKCCGHGVETSESPRGMQWGVLIVPKDFADETLTKFPETCNKLTEVELETFYDEHAHAHEPDELLDEEILTGIRLKQDLGLPLTPNQVRALDPSNDTRGIRKNKTKKWADYKQLVGVEIIQ